MINFENFNPVEWLFENILWVVVSAIFVAIFFKAIPATISALKITRKILRDNRDTRGNAWGKYSADRFLDVWYSSDNLPLRYEQGRFYYKTFNNPNSRHWMDFIDGELIALGLIKKGTSSRGHLAVFAVRTRRNSLIAVLTRYYLIKFIGDNPSYYEDMAAQKKSNDRV